MIEDLRAHFVQRWNFIYNEKYDVRSEKNYKPLKLALNDIPDGYYKADGKNILKLEAGDRNVDDPDSPIEHRHALHLPGGTGSIFDRTMNRFGPGPRIPTGLEDSSHPSGMSVQLVRSCTKWSNGVPTEVSCVDFWHRLS
jgi:phospholipase D1/2